MATFTFRFSDDLKVKAQSFAQELGLSLNALLIVALDEYLRSRTVIKADGSEGQIKESPVEKIQDSSIQDVVVSRNALCPCGSGKKYKKCCGS